MVGLIFEGRSKVDYLHRSPAVLIGVDHLANAGVEKFFVKDLSDSGVNENYSANLPPNIRGAQSSEPCPIFIKSPSEACAPARPDSAPFNLVFNKATKSNHKGHVL